MMTFLLVIASLVVLYVVYKYLKTVEVAKGKRIEKFISRTQYTNSERIQRSLEEMDKLNKSYNENPSPISRSLKKKVVELNTLQEKKKEDSLFTVGFDPILDNDRITSSSSSSTIIDFNKDNSDEGFGHGGSFGGGGASGYWATSDSGSSDSAFSSDYSDSGSSDSSSCDSGSSD